jgi:hypothetical protein
MRQLMLRPLVTAFAILVVAPAARGQIEEMEMRAAFFDQTGSGYQSAAGPERGPGSENALIFEPLFHLKIRQDEAWSHSVDVTVDIVSNASIDAIDAMSSASALNEAVTVDITTSYKKDDHRADVRYGFHIEEPFRSLFLGGGYTWSLADDNAAISLSGLGTFDFFDAVNRIGRDDGVAERQSLNGNLGVSQILSPTTIFDASYGLTLQTGRLETTWNSVPLAGGGRADEIFAGRRLRHALAARLAQHIAATRTTVKAAYRFYVDNYDLSAHTVEGQLYQYLADWLYVRGSYRYHMQTGVGFFGTAFRALPAQAPETSDSDLAPFAAHEIGLKIVFLAERSPWEGLKRSFIDASFYHYFRSNNLAVNWLTVAFGKRF